VVMSSLAINAIFYTYKHKPGHVSFGVKFLYAFWSSLLVVPLNLMIYFLLWKAQHRSWTDVQIDTDKKLPTSRWKKLRMWFLGPWAWYWAVIGYIIAFLVIFFSTFLVFLLGSSFNDVALDGWVISSILTIAQDILLNQPIASICGAILGTFFGGVTEKIVIAVTNFIQSLTGQQP